MRAVIAALLFFGFFFFFLIFFVIPPPSPSSMVPFSFFFLSGTGTGEDDGFTYFGQEIRRLCTLSTGTSGCEAVFSLSRRQPDSRTSLLLSLQRMTRSSLAPLPPTRRSDRLSSFFPCLWCRHRSQALSFFFPLFPTQNRHRRPSHFLICIRILMLSVRLFLLPSLA